MLKFIELLNLRHSSFLGKGQWSNRNAPSGVNNE